MTVASKTATILRCYVSRLVLERDSPVSRFWQQDWRLLAANVDKVQLDSILAVPVRLAAVLTSGKAFVTFQMALPTCQAAGPHTLRFAGLSSISTRGSARAIGQRHRCRRVLGDARVVESRGVLEALDGARAGVRADTALLGQAVPVQ